jgi:hypothetical protein
MAPHGNRLLHLLLAILAAAASTPYSVSGDERAVVEVSGAPDGVVWVVQLSDLHFSVHHPERAYDFRRYVGPALAMVNPDLVFITGDLTGAYSYPPPLAPLSFAHPVDSLPCLRSMGDLVFGLVRMGSCLIKCGEWVDDSLRHCIGERLGAQFRVLQILVYLR